MGAPTQAGIDLWTGFCGDAIRLRNRRMLMRTLWLAAIAASFVWLHPKLGDYRYWTELFGGRAGKDDYFNVRTHRTDAYALLCIAGLFLSFAGYTGSIYARRRMDFASHPFARKLALRGHLELVVPEVDGQYAAPLDRIGPLVITSGWLILETRWKVIPVRLADVVWVFREQVGEDYIDPIIRDRYGERLKLGYLTIKQKSRLYAKVTRLAPQAIQGYDLEVDALWAACVDKSTFPATVQKLYPGRRTDRYHSFYGVSDGDGRPQIALPAGASNDQRRNLK